MLELIVGGSGSGKSAFAESEALRLHNEMNTGSGGSSGSGGPKPTLFYLATMENKGEEAGIRIKRHRAERKGKGFLTIEQPADIGNLSSYQPGKSAGEAATLLPGSSGTLLLESLSSLLANEMFREDPPGMKKYMEAGPGCEISAGKQSILCRKLLSDIDSLYSSLKNLIIVSDDVFRDGIIYSAETEQYRRVLSSLHRSIASLSDRVIEVHAGRAVMWK